MKTNMGTLALRLLTIIPAIIALIALMIAGACAGLAMRYSLWALLLSILLVIFAILPIRCCYFAWRKPSPATVRELCGWTGLAIVVLGRAIINHNNRFENAWVEWGGFILLLFVANAAYEWLTQYMLRKMFGPDRLK